MSFEVLDQNWAVTHRSVVPPLPLRAALHRPSDPTTLNCTQHLPMLAALLRT